MAMVEEISPERRSLEEVHGSVAVPSARGTSGRFRQFLAFLGPAYLVSVGYMDPGNWATDLAGGAQFGYALIWVLLMSNLMAVLLQTLAARLGVVTGHDLAQACRAEYSPGINAILWVLAEVAIAATDLAEILGTIIALKLLFGLPLLWGCLVTAFDTFLLLYLQRWGMRQVEAVILALVATIGLCFLVQIFMAKPDLGGIVSGLRPSLPPGALYVAIGILGATVMPHNLYLHSALVQTRRIGSDRRSKAIACRYYLIDSAIALNAAFFVNAAILIVSAAVFHNVREVASIEDAHELLPLFLGPVAPILFGVALLCAGQSSTLTGTLAGQIVMEGYLHLRMAPWLRRLITRLLALIPAVLVISMTGEAPDLRLMSAVDNVSGIPTEAKNLIVVADVEQVLHVRIFDSGGKVVVDTDTTRLTGPVRPIEDLRKQLETLWPPHELTESEKHGVAAAVTEIVGYTPGGQTTQGLIILSQVILSLQLSFAVIPLIHFTSNRRNMGVFATPAWGQVLAWTTATIIVALNGKLVLDQVGEWVELAAESSRRFGPIPLSWLVAGGLYGLTGAVGALLLWVTIKPIVRPSPAWLPQPAVKLDWMAALRPRTLSRIGVALEHNQADAEILNRALGLAQSQSSPAELLLLHVVDTAMTRVLGPETADRETAADERYLSDLVDALRARGYSARSVLLYGPDPAGELVAHLRRDPVDLLVVGSHGHGMVRDLLLGQTVNRVRHRLEVPMLIARPARDGTPSTPLPQSPSLKDLEPSNERLVPDDQV